MKVSILVLFFFEYCFVAGSGSSDDESSGGEGVRVRLAERSTLSDGALGMRGLR